MINIRKANVLDLIQIEQIVVNDNVLATIPSFNNLVPDLKKCREMATYWTVNERGLVYVAEDNNKIVGFVLGELFNPWCSNELFATDYALYVIEEYRYKRIGIKLLDYFTSECKRLGAKKLITGMAINSFNIEAMEKLLTRKGFKLVAKYYEKEL